MSNFGQKTQVAAGQNGDVYLRDYTHASKIFRSNYYANTPKFKFLFHTQFNLNAGVYPTAVPDSVGILVRDVKLPTFGFNVATMNQYNRKRLVQTKIKYEPISISFFDDNDNTINKLWFAYYTYYYKDGGKPQLAFSGRRTGSIPDINIQSTVPGYSYNERNTYKDSITGDDDWGYIGETSEPGTPSGVKLPFFKNITVFGFNQHNFTAYTFINPLITTFSHDSFNYDEGGGVMKNSMTIDYETVTYYAGNLDGKSPNEFITSFGNEGQYDRKSSPISGPDSNSQVTGQGGLLNAAGGAVKSFWNKIRPPAVVDTQLAYSGIKDIDLNINVGKDVEAQYRDALKNSPSLRNAPFDIPTGKSSPGPQGLAGTPAIAQRSTFTPSLEQPAGTQINGGRNNA